MDFFERSEATSKYLTYAPIAQLVEQRPLKAIVPGPSPGGRTRKENYVKMIVESHHSKPQKNPEKNVGSNHILIFGEENFLIIKSKIIN